MDRTQHYREGGWGWLVVLANFLSEVIVYGSLKGFGVLIIAMKDYFDVDLWVIGSIGSLHFGVQFVLSEAAASPVVKKLREMVKGRRGAQPGPSRKTSTTLRVHIGWKHKAKFQKSHKQVIAGKGGGGYDIDLPRDAGITDLKKAVINLLFPQGRNEVQNLNIADLQPYLSTFSGHLWQPSLNSGDPFTMEGYFEEVKTHPVRIYLVTTDKQENDSDIDEDDSLPDVFPSGNNTNSSSSSHRRNNSSSNRRNDSHH